MQPFAILVLGLAFLVSLSHGHTVLKFVGANGNAEGHEECVVPSPKFGNSPVLDPESKDLRCRGDDLSVSKCPVPAGGKVTVIWRHKHNSVQTPVMSSSHNGPCFIYLAPLESQGEGPVWIKLWQSGYSTEEEKWCTNQIIDNDGVLDVDIPENILDGDYILRTELFALPQPKSGLNAQFYCNCAVITIEGGTGVSFPAGESLPGDIYKPGEAGIMWNRFKSPPDYEFPGPPIYDFGSESSGKNSTTSKNSKADEGSTTDEDSNTGKSSKADKGSTSGENSKASDSTNSTDRPGYAPNSRRRKRTLDTGHI